MRTTVLVDIHQFCANRRSDVHVMEISVALLQALQNRTGGLVLIDERVPYRLLPSLREQLRPLNT